MNAIRVLVRPEKDGELLLRDLPVQIDVILDPSHPAFPHSGLKVASVFKVFKVASLSDALIIGPLGRLEDVVFRDVVDRLVHLPADRPDAW